MYKVKLFEIEVFPLIVTSHLLCKLSGEHWLQSDYDQVLQWISVMKVVSKTPATTKMELFVTIVKIWKTLTVVLKGSSLNVSGIGDLFWKV